MLKPTLRLLTLSLALSLAAATTIPAGTVWAQATAVASKADRTGEFGRDLWSRAAAADSAGFYKVIDTASKDGLPADLAAAVERFKAHLADREAARGKRLAEVREELTKKLAEPTTNLTISKELISAMEIYELSTDKDAVLSEPVMVELIANADKAARAAEAAGDWLTSSELFVRLSLLMEETDKAKGYKDDVERVTQRIAMLRLYTPKRLWELQNDRRIANGDKPLPPYNPAADDYNDKLATITPDMAVDALTKAGTSHVEKADFKAILLAAIDDVRNMMTTTDLRLAFPGLADETAVKTMLAALDESAEKTKKSNHVTASDCDRTLRRILSVAAQTVKVMPQAIVHEFGNGGISALDEFSAIIWPDERFRFDKLTRGNFVGVGVQIEFDEQSNVKVVTPLEGTPAQRKGIMPDDLIKKVNGQSLFGVGLDQVVELITGPRGTDVTLTVERKVDDPAKPGEKLTKELDFTLKRDKINVAAISGWKRQSAKAKDWDWIVDKDSKIGYVRMLSFSETTTSEFKDALYAMKGQGAKALILDLRFNPGGLLNQAVSVVQRFVDKGLIVMQQRKGGPIEQPQAADGTATLNDTPTVILVNRGSASASEIVSGALQHYGKRGDIPAVVMGSRSFGKGSVQEVRDLGDSAALMKLTTHYYLLPDQRIIHRKPGAKVWGIEPNVNVEMLPKQIADEITLRKNADVLPGEGEPRPPADPAELLAKGTDLQLEAAILLLKAKLTAAPTQARADK